MVALKCFVGVRVEAPFTTCLITLAFRLVFGSLPFGIPNTQISSPITDLSFFIFGLTLLSRGWRPTGLAHC